MTTKEATRISQAAKYHAIRGTGRTDNAICREAVGEDRWFNDFSGTDIRDATLIAGRARKSILFPGQEVG